MFTIRIYVTVCATAVMLAAVMSSQADEGGPFAGIKGLFSGRSSYAILADHLYKTTGSVELAVNTKTARSLLIKYPPNGKHHQLHQLVLAFGSLKDASSSEPESFCGSANLANLRRVIEGLRDGGNLGPEKITDAIKRLNGIVIKVAGEARDICDPYLAGKWPSPWAPSFSDQAMKARLVNLYLVADSYLYEGYVNRSLARPFTPSYQSASISYALEKSEQQADTRIEPGVLDPLVTTNSKVLGLQVDKYIYKPCSEFVFLDEVVQVLVPENDLLKSWFVLTSGLLDKYYENEGAPRPEVSGTHKEFDKKLRGLAFSYQACQRFLATPEKDLVNRIRKHRLDRPS